MSASTDGELFAWVEVEPDGREGVIAAYMPGIEAMVTLHHRSRHIAIRMRQTALAHGRATKRTVRLVRFARAETIEEVTQ